MIDSGYYDPVWKIIVNSVPTECVGSVKEQIINKILQEAAEWLGSENCANQTWQRFYNLKTEDFTCTHSR